MYIFDKESQLVDSMIISLRSSLPPIFVRREIPKLLGNAISIGTLANLASEGYGAPSTRNGRHAVYEKESFLEWFALYLRGGIKLIKEQYTQRE